MDEVPDQSAESQLIAAFADFVRSARSGEPAAPMADALLSVADAARYLNVSTTTVRNLALGGKFRSARIGDRLRFRRAWLDEFVDAGGGDVPPPLPTSPRPPSEHRHARPASRSAGRRSEPRPKPPTHVQRVGDQEIRLLSDGAHGRFARLQTWHVGDRAPLCGAAGHWTGKVERWPRAFLCAKCLTVLGALPDADLSRFAVGRLAMMRTTFRGTTETTIRTGFHTGDGRRTLCGRKDGPWTLTERTPRTKPCLVCDHRLRWEARDDDPNTLSPRPLTPMRVLVDKGPLDPRLRTLLEAHPRSLDARQAVEPLDEQARWSESRLVAIHRAGEPICQFAGQPTYLRGDRAGWPVYTVSDRPDLAFATTDTALERLPEWAEDIDRALDLYKRWASDGARPGRRPQV